MSGPAIRWLSIPPLDCGASMIDTGWPTIWSTWISPWCDSRSRWISGSRLTYSSTTIALTSSTSRPSGDSIRMKRLSWVSRERAPTALLRASAMDAGVRPSSDRPVWASSAARAAPPIRPAPGTLPSIAAALATVLMSSAAAPAGRDETNRLPDGIMPFPVDVKLMGPLPLS